MKPTYTTLRQSLEDMKNVLLLAANKPSKWKIAMPQIGCGLDRLEWNRVSEIIKEVFDDTNIEITGYKKGD